MEGVGRAGQLLGMPAPYELRRGRAEDGDTVISYGPKVLFRFDPADRGMRNLAMVALTGAGVAGKAVAEVFGVRAEHVSRLRTRAARDGSAGLVPSIGPPRKLSRADEDKALRLVEDGHSGAEVAARFGVSGATISRLLTRRRARAVPVSFEEATEEPSTPQAPEAPGPHSDAGPAGEPGPGSRSEATGDAAVTCVDEAGTAQAVEPCGTSVAEPCGASASGEASRLSEVEVPSRYAGAMLLHPFICRLGADAVLASLPAGPARRYDAPSLLGATTFSFALGVSSMEGTKHLVVADAGALVGLGSFPHLRTLRPRLKDLAEATDPLAIQRAFAQAMLRADEHPPEVFYVDDHFVTYWGKAPVAKGYNVRRHLAEPGRDDTFCVDDTWRAICFTSGEPRGLSVSLPEVLSELKDIVGGCRVMVGFDRGGSYPKVFSALAEANMDWVTWRRAPLVAPTATPRRSWAPVGGERKTLLLADEIVTLDGYDAGPVRQLSAYENAKVAFQILTSNNELKGAPMVHKLRGRWCIENTNKYLEDHQGVHWLCTYEMGTEANTAKVANPARRAVRATVREAETSLAEAERALGRQADRPVSDVDEHLSALRERRDAVTRAKDDLDAAKAGLKGVPAKLPANELDPNAKRAKPRLAARSLQMVCRLLAYNAELDLARRLNAYLGDNDEYRAITRNLLHLGGRIAYARRQITVTLARPDSPRIARALGLLVEDLNTERSHLLGDRRPIIYRLETLSG